MMTSPTYPFLIISSLFFSFNAIADVCNVSEFSKRNPIYCRIRELKPNVNNEFAWNLSNYLYHYSKRMNTDALISVAIGMQESRLTNINRYTTIFKDGKKFKGVSDIGVFQISVATAISYNVDVQRLLNDIEYQVFVHVFILKQKERVCSSVRYRTLFNVSYGDEWSCYHSFNKHIREPYKELVTRFLAKKELM